MSLYQQLNNEALDEDRRADLEVIRRLKQNYTDNKEKAKQSLQLDNIQKNTLKKNFGLFERQLYKIIGYVEGKREIRGQIDVSEITKLISDVIASFNSVCLFVQTLSYSKLSVADQQYIDRQFNSFINTINLAKESLSGAVDDSILSPLSEMVDKIKLKVYEPISFGVSKILEELPKKREEREFEQSVKKRQEIFERLTNDDGNLKAIARFSTDDLFQALKKLGVKTGDIPKSKNDRYDLLVELNNEYLDDSEKYENLEEEKQAKLDAEQERKIEEIEREMEIEEQRKKLYDPDEIIARRQAQLLLDAEEREQLRLLDELEEEEAIRQAELAEQEREREEQEQLLREEQARQAMQARIDAELARQAEEQRQA